MKNFKDKLKTIKAFAFDVDGVFTNGLIFTDGNGVQMRGSNAKDGYAVHYAKKMGYPIAIITGGRCKSIIKRYGDLGVEDIFIEASNKVEYLDIFLKKYNLKAKDVMYMGDDLPDYHIMKKCGVKVCPADASVEIQEIADYISIKKGGEGCVRDVIEQTLRAQDKWLTKDAFVW